MHQPPVGDDQVVARHHPALRHSAAGCLEGAQKAKSKKQCQAESSRVPSGSALHKKQKPSSTKSKSARKKQTLISGSVERKATGEQKQEARKAKSKKCCQAKKQKP